MPPGAEAFRAGEVYSHGGLSPQECVIPDITVGGDAATATSCGRTHQHDQLAPPALDRRTHR